MQIINELASIVNLICGILFYVFVFGRESKRLQSLPLMEQWFLRLSLIFIASGSLWNVLYLSYPPNVEILINCGYALLFIWAVKFHYRMFVKNK